MNIKGKKKSIIHLNKEPEMLLDDCDIFMTCTQSLTSQSLTSQYQKSEVQAT